MVNSRIPNNHCLICGKEILKEEQKISVVKVKSKTEFLAHQDCIEALKLFFSKSLELPKRTNGSSTELIYQLYLDGWFSIARKLSEVVNKLQQLGFNFSSSRVAHVLRDLTRRGVLSRQGRSGEYEYIQKRPP